ncbi:MAG: aromatic amino acid ammonia-lyase [Patescibacteria group bacterium]|nr:aromatic amino acid ammonia-lyase [Patescibacteria group bacterium]
MKNIVRLEIDGHSLTIEQVVSVARHHTRVEANASALESLKEMRAGLQVCIDRGDVIYGVNTGCGSRKTTVLKPEELSAYQMAYIPAHCCGDGDLLDEEVVRAAMLIRLNSFLGNHSGLRPLISERLRDFLNLDITPCIPRLGSVGASGDLVPLAHMSAALIGMEFAEVFVRGEDGTRTRIPAREALKRHDLETITLQAKEAMGLTNGANFIAGIGCLAVSDGWALFSESCLSLGLSLEAIRGEKNAFDERIHKMRPLPGQLRVAEMMRRLIGDSKRMTEESRGVSLRNEKPTLDEKGKKVPRVQDAYSFRCAPQIFASAFHALAHAAEILQVEINSSTDNPLIFREGDGFKTISGGNFHGQPLASILEYVGIGLAPLAGSSDRRLFALLSSGTSFGLPDDLAGPSHGNTGLMIQQYAGAALVNKIGHLSAPSSVHSVPTSANQEDWVSMGMNSALNLREMLPLIRKVIATEMLAACQGIKLTEDELPLSQFPLGSGTYPAYRRICKAFFDGFDSIKPEEWFPDRNTALEVDSIVAMLVSGEFGTTA